MVLGGISRCFHLLSPCLGQIVHALLTRPPLEYRLPSRRTSNGIPARLACVKHAASVQSEPESNSPVQVLYKILTLAGENRNLKDFLPTRYSLVNEPPGLPAPPDLSVGARSVYAPLRFRSQPFFSLPAKFLFCRVLLKNPFSQVALQGYAPHCRLCQPFFSLPAKFLLPWAEPFRFQAAKGECSPAPSLCQTLFGFFSKKPASPRGALSWPKGRRQGLPRRSGFTPGTAARQRGRCPRWSKFPLGMRMLKVYGALVPTFKRASS